METGAEFSECSQYRYSLWRIWNKDLPLVAFIGLNPSTADEKEDDPTIRKCIKYAQNWGFGGVYMVNLFAYRATKPEDMFSAKDPIGKANNIFLEKISKKVSTIVAAWGDNGVYLDRYKHMKIFPQLMCLKINKSGQPAHPLYQRDDTKLIPYVIDKQ